MTNPSHTELAARLRARAEIHKTLPFPSANDKITAIELEECAAALESPERVLGEVVAYTVAGQVHNWSRDFSIYKTQHYVRPVYAAPPAAPAQDAQWEHRPGCDALGGYGQGVGPCSCGAATPSPQAEKQPLSEADEALMRQALAALKFSHPNPAVQEEKQRAITALRARLETSNV